MSRVSEQPQLTEQSPEKPEKRKVLWGLAIVIPVAIAFGALTLARMEQLRQLNQPAANKPVTNSVNAIGRLEPRGAVIKLSAPTSGLQASSRVDQILVKEGQRVRQGEVIAILDNHGSNQAVVEEAKAKLQEARANLANVKAVSPRDLQAQTAVLARLKAQLAGEMQAQQAGIARLGSQLSAEKVAQQALVRRLEAELRGQKNAFRATVAKIRAEQRNTRIDLRRYEILYQEGAVSQQERDRRLLQAEQATQQLRESQATRNQTIAILRQQIKEAQANRTKVIATLRQQIKEAQASRNQTITTLQRQIQEQQARFNRIRDTRPSTFQMAQAQLNNAVANTKKAEAELRLSYVVAPIAGEILKIHTKAGETMGPNGIAEIGRTDQMIVVAEVPEDSISKVRLGQPATITSENGAFRGELQGTVTEIGRKIGKKNVFNNDPAADVDARVVEVKISLPPQDSDRVAGLTDAKVLVQIFI
ncbi:MAG: HlyD family efflux transporter periplasmic adaptor subunit [Calothrix sp. MO_192.B10]|nr:HlyD family efflux transporter periplasmic adaptor subunit [Calothrix sp. MO_192.B10]